jgi:hypothetical protein
VLTKLTIRNFKRFAAAEIELGNPVVFIGPNNSGKTTALQAIALWEVGLRRSTINRKDLVAVPAPHAKLPWKDVHVKDVRIEIVIAGVTADHPWTYGLEFEYANEESLYCRPLQNTTAPPEALATRVAFLTPMSGLADREFLKTPGEIDFLIGQGRTAEVLRNLCFQVAHADSETKWQALAARIRQLFGIELDEPESSGDRDGITITYREPSGIRLDLSSAGRGVHQTLLLLAYLSVNPESVLLLDEPDAHLEILRQRQIYNVLSEAAREQESQVVNRKPLRSAPQRSRGTGRGGGVCGPAAPDERPSQPASEGAQGHWIRGLLSGGAGGWVLYLEGSTDLAILRAFAAKLQHAAHADLESPFVHYVENQPPRARDHFYGLLEAKPDQAGFLLNDRMDRSPQAAGTLTEAMWERREIENYLCQPETLLAWAETSAEETSPGPLFTPAQAAARRKLMDECVHELVPPLALRDLDDVWRRNVKASDEFLDRLFEIFFEKLKLPNLMRKTNYHQLASYVTAARIDPEVAQELDLIHQAAQRATPRC